MTAPLYNEQYLNVLNSVYYDNIRQIERLSQTNNEIRQILISTHRGARNNRSNRNHSQNNTNNTNNRNYSSNYTYSRNAPNHGTNNHGTNNHGTNNHVTTNQASTHRTYIDNVDEYAHRLPLYFLDASYNIQRNTIQRPTRNNTFDTLINAFLEPVPTYPGTLQVEIATRNVRYGDIVSPMNTSCPISLEIFTDDDIVTIICYCGHIFMATEIHNWFSSNCRCPVCRYDIREYRSTNVINHANDIVTPSIIPTSIRNSDFSGNLIDSITDTLLNELLNSSTFSNDASSNLMENTLATFYFAFPRRER
jgi:hypothetical protein